MSTLTTSLGPEGVRAARTLTHRELLRMWRQPSRLVGMFGTVLFLWLFIGSGVSASFRSPTGDDGATYGAFLVPGMVTAVVMFGAIFSAITLIQDRDAGFLRGVLVSPAPRWSVVVAKVAGGVVVAVAQAGLILLASPLAGVDLTLLGLIGALIALALAAAGIVSMGLVFAWRIDSVGGFHGVMNLILAPMWLLSGALFPAEGADGWLRFLMRLNPLAWSTRAMGQSLGVCDASVLDWFGAIAFAAAMMWLAWRAMERRPA